MSDSVLVELVVSLYCFDRFNALAEIRTQPVQLLYQLPNRFLASRR
jgi:hypothetical protein